MMKIPQAVAMVLLASVLACPICGLAQIKEDASGTQRGVMATRGAVEVQALLKEFLAKVDDPQMHQRFWADDLVYVGASGKVRTKAEIVKSVTEEAAKADPAKKDSTTFDAEDVKLRQFGTVVVLNFRLVATDSEGKKSYYRNSGVFLERNGHWQAESWQATKEQ